MDWDHVEQAWEAGEKAWLEARRRHGRNETGYDMVMAELLPIYPFNGALASTYFKLVSGGKELEVIWYCPERNRWVQDSPLQGKSVMAKLASNCLRDAVCLPGQDVPLWGRKGKQMRAVVESCASALYDLDFFRNLNSEDSREWLMFKNGVAYNSRTDEVATLGPKLLVSHCCNIDFPADRLSELEKHDGGRLEQILTDVKLSELFMNEEYLEGQDLPTGLKARLDAVAAEALPSLRVLALCHGEGTAVDYRVTIFLLKQFSRTAMFSFFRSIYNVGISDSLYVHHTILLLLATALRLIEMTGPGNVHNKKKRC